MGEEEIPSSCSVTAWRPSVAGISEVFHARIAGYRYPQHFHDTWTVLIVDDGALGYDIDTRHHGAIGDSVSILPPGVIHNGYPSERHGRFRKRNLYLDRDFLPAHIVGPAVDSSTFHDRELRAAISRLHDRLLIPEPLDVEIRLAMIADRFRRRLEARGPSAPAPESFLADELRDFLDGHITAKIRLADAARLFDRDVSHLVRSFKRRFGISPYAYVTARRIEQARKRLLRGQPPAEVAVKVGFYDQAHLTRHFKRHVSVPPAQYAASGLGTRSGRRRSKAQEPTRDEPAQG
ncbi:AraC family transcriptional regulator [Microbispora sp. NPDC049125]|uniref:helix-turn-helix transcriptional regulator n=1 Tax=Microbispora sp. NPDC049125 TaxID=3154929 RepID=UPI003467C91F